VAIRLRKDGSVYINGRILRNKYRVRRQRYIDLLCCLAAAGGRPVYLNDMIRSMYPDATEEESEDAVQLMRITLHMMRRILPGVSITSDYNGWYTLVDHGESEHLPEVLPMSGAR